MSNEIIKVPVTRYLKGKEFYADRTDNALKSLQDNGYRALFMPELADTRINSDKGSRIWQTWFTSPSIRATGITRQGNPVVVYGHVDNYFSDHGNIRKTIEENRLVNYAGIIPQEEFQRLVDLEGIKDQQGNKLVFVVDYEELKNSKSGIIPVKRALKHPQTIPFLGGEERAQRYLERHEEVYGDQIGIWHYDDLHEQPLGRLVYLIYDINGLDGINCINNNGRFVGVRDDVPQKILHPCLEQILKISEDFVPQIAREEYEARLRSLHQ